MPRAIRIASPLLALAVLAVILYNATLVDRVPPTIEKIYLGLAVPGNDRLGQTLTTIDIRFSKPVRTGTVERRFSIAPDVAGSWSWEGQRTAIFTPSHRLPAATHFTVTIDSGFEDQVGNVANAGLDAWTFDTVGPPTVVATSPASGTQDVAVDSTVQITFDRLMDTASVASAVSITPPVPYTLGWKGPVLTIAPRGPLTFATTYTVGVGTDAADTDGTHLATPYSAAFTTVPSGLVATSRIPAPNVSGVNPRSPIAVAFDAPIDSGSIAGAIQVTPPVSGDLRVVSLRDDSQAALLASPSTQPAGHILLFTPSQPLAAHTTYTVTLQPVIHALGSPSQVVAAESWSFTTGQSTQTAQNQVAFLSGRGGVPNVWLMNPDGTNARELTFEMTPVSGFDISPDGSSVAYATAGVVRQMRVDGSGLTTLTAGGELEYAPSYTPDGSGLVVGRRDATGGDQGYWRISLLSGVADHQVTTSGAPPIDSVSLIGDGIDPGPGLPAWARRSAFTVDGRYLLLVGGDGGVRLVDFGTTPATGGNPSGPPTVTPLSLTSDSAPVWVPHDAAFYLVAQTDANAAPAVWRIRPGRDPAQVMGGTGGVAVSPDGQLATLTSAVAGPTQLLVAQSGGAVPIVVASDQAAAARSPAFAPDGSVLLFGRVSARQPTVSNGIWAVGLDGTDLRQLSPDGAYPRWLP